MHQEKPTKVESAQRGSPKKQHCTARIIGRPHPELPPEPEPKKKKVVMVPCNQIKSNNNSVTYKAGYDTELANPMPKDDNIE